MSSLAVSAALPAAGQGGPPVVIPPPPAPVTDVPLPEIDPAAPLPPLPDLGVEWPNADVPAAEQAAGAPDEEASVRYRTEVSGLRAIGLEEEFRAISALTNAKEAANLAQIRLRAEEDAGAAVRLLRSAGYYAGSATFAIEPAAELGGIATVRLNAVPGERYDYAEVNLVITGGAEAGLREALSERLALRPGDPVDAEATLAAETRVKAALPNLGHPFARFEPLDVLVDHNQRHGVLTLAVEPGPQARFAAIRQQGTPDLGAAHVANIARFEPGDVYSEDLVDDLRRALIATSLFASVGVEAVPAGGDRARADILINTTPGPMRTLAGEVGYDTEDGFRAEASWRHRNLFPPEGALVVRGVGGTREQSLGAEVIKSNWRERDRYLTGRVNVARLDTDAFESLGFNALALYEKRSTVIWRKRLSYSLGAELLVAREDDRSGTTTQNYFLLAFPLGVGLDFSNDLFDPTSGWRVDMRMSPEVSLQGDYGYVRGRLQASGYLPVTGRTVLAGRAAAGFITGADRDQVPPSRRYYVGGGGSVRGYGYQDIGPKDAEGDPTGGRSFLEFSAEVRQKITDTIGIAAFMDGGALYQAEFPEGGDFRYGYGIGARYYTSFGPVRVDLARPLGRRPGEPDVALYFSIGQAF